MSDKKTKKKIAVMGKVIHRINGKVVKVKKNAIHTDLLAYFRDSMDTAVDKAINDLLSAGEVAPGGVQDGKDGIALYDGTAETWLSFTTTVVSATETYGKRWKGSVTVSQAREVTSLALGHSYENSVLPFDTVFATQTFAGLALQSGATYEVEWEPYLVYVET